MIVLALMFAGILWLFVMGMERGTRSPSAAGCWGLVVSLILSLVLGSPALLLIGFLMMLAGFVCHWRGVHGVRFALASFAMIPVPLFFLAVASHERIDEYRELREKYKFVSLAERLEYESRAKAAITLDAAVPEVQAVNLSTESVGLMEDIDQNAEQQRFLRPMFLQQLHQTELDAFANSPGFGVTRGIRFYSEEQIRTEPRPAIVPPAAPEVPYSPDGTRPAAPDIVQGETREGELPIEFAAVETLDFNETQATVPSTSRLKKLHRDSAIDFVNPLGFGLVDSPQRVAGFDAHAFSKLPALDPSASGGAESDRNDSVSNHDWMLVSLQLVSMLKHHTPVIYATNELPQMERLRSEDIPTRALDAFESSALPKIKQGELLVVEEATNRIRMLGAVRAGRTCIECHEVPQNTLLGAFSYEIVRQKPLSEGRVVIEQPEL